MKENLAVEIVSNFKNISNFFSAPLLTVLVLVFVLMRNPISNMIISSICKALDIERYKVKSKNTLLKLFIISLGIYFLFIIWSKNIALIRKIKNITIIIGIYSLAKIITYFISPEILKSRNNSFNITEENFLLKKFIINIVKILIYIVAFFLMLIVLKININGLMAGLGIGSAIIALAVQDVFKNIIAGSSIIAEKPFIIGDFISIEGANITVETSGTVKDISLRSTTIRRIDNSLLNIPNSMIAVSAVKNITRIDNRRIEINIKLPTYLLANDIDRIKNKIKMVFSNNSKVIAESIVIVLNNISDEGYNLFIYCYINDSRYEVFLEQKDKMLLSIIDIMKSENINFQNKNINIYYTENKNDNKNFKKENKKEIKEKEKSKKLDSKIKIRNM